MPTPNIAKRFLDKGEIPPSSRGKSALLSTLRNQILTNTQQTENMVIYNPKNPLLNTARTITCTGTEEEISAIRQQRAIRKRLDAIVDVQAKAKATRPAVVHRAASTKPTAAIPAKVKASATTAPTATTATAASYGKQSLTMPRSEFDKMTPADRSRFSLAGHTLTN